MRLDFPLKVQNSEELSIRGYLLLVSSLQYTVKSKKHMANLKVRDISLHFSKIQLSQRREDPKKSALNFVPLRLGEKNQSLT